MIRARRLAAALALLSLCLVGFACDPCDGPAQPLDCNPLNAFKVVPSVPSNGILDAGIELADAGDSPSSDGGATDDAGVP